MILLSPVHVYMYFPSFVLNWLFQVLAGGAMLLLVVYVLTVSLLMPTFLTNLDWRSEISFSGLYNYIWICLKQPVQNKRRKVHVHVNGGKQNHRRLPHYVLRRKQYLCNLERFQQHI